MKVLVFQAIGTLLFAAILANLANAISDFRLCADESCDKVISKGTTLRKHFATESTELSFDAGEKVEIYSKSAGVQLDYWGGKINGERGYFPYQVIQEDEVFVQIPEHVRPTEENTDEFDTELDDEEEVDEEEDDQEDDDYGDDDVGDATEDQASNDDSLDEDAPDSHQAASESDNTEADSEPSGETDDSAANIHTSDNPEDDSTDNQSARDDKDASIKSQSESDEVDASPDLSRTASDLEEFDSHSSDDAENTETVSETHLSPDELESQQAELQSHIQEIRHNFLRRRARLRSEIEPQSVGNGVVVDGVYPTLFSDEFEVEISHDTDYTPFPAAPAEIIMSTPTQVLSPLSPKIEPTPVYFPGSTQYRPDPSPPTATEQLPESPQSIITTTALPDYGKPEQPQVTDPPNVKDDKNLLEQLENKETAVNFEENDLNRNGEGGTPVSDTSKEDSDDPLVNDNVDYNSVDGHMQHSADEHFTDIHHTSDNNSNQVLDTESAKEDSENRKNNNFPDLSHVADSTMADEKPPLSGDTDLSDQLGSQDDLAKSIVSENVGDSYKLPLSETHEDQSLKNDGNSRLRDESDVILDNEKRPSSKYDESYNLTVEKSERPDVYVQSLTTNKLFWSFYELFSEGSDKTQTDAQVEGESTLEVTEELDLQVTKLEPDEQVKENLDQQSAKKTNHPPDSENSEQLNDKRSDLEGDEEPYKQTSEESDQGEGEPHKQVNENSEPQDAKKTNYPDSDYFSEQSDQQVDDKLSDLQVDEKPEQEMDENPFQQIEEPDKHVVNLHEKENPEQTAKSDEQINEKSDQKADIKPDELVKDIIYQQIKEFDKHANEDQDQYDNGEVDLQVEEKPHEHVNQIQPDKNTGRTVNSDIELEQNQLPSNLNQLDDEQADGQIDGVPEEKGMEESDIQVTNETLKQDSEDDDSNDETLNIMSEDTDRAEKRNTDSLENDASDEASDVPSKDSTTVDSEEINQHVAEDTEVQDSTVSSSEESLSSTPSGDDTEVKERDIEADVRDTYISATETEHTDDHQTVLSSEHKLPAEQSDVSDTPLDEIQKTEPEEFEVTMEASSELEASKTGDSIEPSMISVDEIKVSVTDDLTVIPGDGVPDDSSTQIVKDIDIAPLTDTASGHSDESDNIINVEATEPLDENEGDDDVRTTIVDGTVIDLDEYEYSAVITPSQTFSDLDLPDLPTPAISDTKPSPSPATIEDKVDTVQPTSVLDGIDLLSITDISGHAGDAYSPSPGDFMSRKTLEVTEPGIDGSQPEEPHTDYETVTDSPIEHKASPLIEEDVTVTPKPVTHASLIEPPTIPQLGTEEEVDAFCADKLTATNGMLLTYVQAVNNVDRVMDKILFVLPGTVRSFLEIEFLGMPQCRKLEMLLLMIYWFLVYLFYKWINYGLTVRRHRKHVTIAEMEHERFCFEIERNTAQRELKEALEKMKEFENCTAITNEEVQHQKLQQEKTEREAQKLNKLLKNKTDELELMRQELSQQTASLQEACQQNNDYQTRIAEMNDHTKLIEKQLAEAKNELMNASSQVTSSTFQADNMAEQISLLQQSKDQLLLESEGWNEKVTELNSVVEQLSEEKKFIQEQNDYKDSEIEVLRDCYKKLKVVGSSENDEEDSENTDYILQEKFQDMTNVARVNTILNAVEEEKASMKQKLKIEIESREELEGQVRLLQSQMEMMKEGNRKAQEQSEDATTRLAVLSNYFKEKELQMQKALGEQEANRKEKDNILETKEEQKKRVEAELHLNREQIEDLKGEIENAESNYRKQISVHEKKAHENWLAARQAERDLKEAKSEAVTLRQKLTASEEERQHLNHVGLIRPLATRPMPPPGMMNGPPPRPSPPPMPPLRDGSPLDRGRPPPFMPLDRPLPPHMRGDGRHQMGPPPMDPRSPPSDMRSPPPPPHMGRHSPPHRSPPPHMRRSPPPPGHMDRRSPPPLYHGPPPPHRMGPMPPRGPPPPHGYSRHPPSMDRPYRDHSPPPPPPPHIRPGMQEPHDPRTSSPRDGRPNF